MLVWESRIFTALVLCGDLLLAWVLTLALLSYSRGEIDPNILAFVVSVCMAIFATQCLVGGRFWQTLRQGTALCCSVMPSKSNATVIAAFLLLPCAFCLIITQVFGIVGIDSGSDPQWFRKLMAGVVVVVLHAFCSIRIRTQKPILAWSGIPLAVLGAIEVCAAVMLA
jgi:hypothetical protein